MEPTFILLLSCYIAYDYKHTHMQTHTHTLCSYWPPAAIRLSVAPPGVTSSPCVVWCSQAPPTNLTFPAPLPQQAPPPNPRCCMSVSQCNLQFHVRLGSNDNNMVIIMTIIICYCVCVYCSRLVLSSVQSQPRLEREREARESIYYS